MACLDGLWSCWPWASSRATSCVPRGPPSLYSSQQATCDFVGALPTTPRSGDCIAPAATWTNSQRLSGQTALPSSDDLPEDWDDDEDWPSISEESMRALEADLDDGDCQELGWDNVYRRVPQHEESLKFPNPETWSSNNFEETERCSTPKACGWDRLCPGLTLQISSYLDVHGLRAKRATSVSESSTKAFVAQLVDLLKPERPEVLEEIAKISRKLEEEKQKPTAIVHYNFVFTAGLQGYCCIFRSGTKVLNRWWDCNATALNLFLHRLVHHSSQHMMRLLPVMLSVARCLFANLKGHVDVKRMLAQHIIWIFNTAGRLHHTDIERGLECFSLLARNCEDAQLADTCVEAFTEACHKHSHREPIEETFGDLGLHWPQDPETYANQGCLTM
ncbi:unnamed protein product [Cladocopium goreaui]|uniref:Uncharacterized protein n=1 Tax=Cladocopium goreaui TaxID=2562237 RepID=A0A9P1CBK1_9DINO|nr:unnamed protein product [Cladocopium goreaui]|mmetsp:Transcript_33753/g.72921  ORF Transcript_33753/g.72921 Transcript_33753/m.72921 type:complete len:390 (+) Transcript_33753:36-1205(+)